MPAADLRARVEHACLDALARVGPAALDRGAIIKSCEGLKQRTGYRYIAEYIDSGRAGQQLARRVQAAATARAARAADPASDVAREAGEVLPFPAAPELVLGGGPVSMMEHLATAIRAAQEVMAHTRGPDGKVRNARLLLAASDRLRQCLDTALGIYAAMHDLRRIETFNAAVVAEIAQESGDLAERVMARLHRIAGEWGG
jgi:hypothetical protein